MNLDTNWVPMKWPCGPLEIARRNRSGTINADVKEMIEAWGQPSALDLLKGTPINCLVVDWAYGGPEDSAQQQALKPLLEAGRRLGLSFVGKVAMKEGTGAAVVAARAAGLSAVMLEDTSGQSSDLPAILQFQRDKVAWDTASTIFSSKENIWPGLNLETMRGDTAIGGPTGVPWVDSNGWFSLLAGELAPGKILWLDFDPPDTSTVLHPASYALAIADSRAYGSRWIISLDDKLRAALPKGNLQAKSVWDKVCEAAAFFESHRDWETFKSQGVLAVISDFRGENASSSGEVLNLLNRRQVQFLIFERTAWHGHPARAHGQDGRATTKDVLPPTQGLKAMLWLDKEAPSAEQHSQLLAFVRQGGLVIAATYLGPQEVKPTKKDPSIHYKMYNVGKGQMAVAEEGFQDPYQVAVDTHLLVSRRNDLVRLYNPAATNCHSSIDPGHRKRLIQVLNYSSDPADSVTLWVNARVESAKLWQPGTKDARTLQGVAAAPGTDFGLPPLSVYCALEFEDSNL
jgi:hypothetical protein